MHTHCELIMPPTDDVEGEVSKILAPWAEDADIGEGESSRYAFWDYYEIGGRWAGSKILATLDKTKISEFYKELHNRKVTQGAFIAGKPELKPEDQQESVDALWRDMFPESGIDKCPLFQHCGDRLSKDIDTLANLPAILSCHHVIIAANCKIITMYEESIYNGVNHQKTTWDGTVQGALTLFAEYSSGFRDEYREKVTPKPDWLVVTIDYHN